MSRAESAHSLVRPWESRRDMGRTNARHSAGTPVTVKGPSQPPAAVGNGNSKRVGASVDASAADKHQRAAVALSESSEGEEGWCSPAEDSANGSDRRSPCVKIDGRTSPRYAMPLTSDSHVRKPSLSVILNLENKNSHLRGMCPPRNSDYDGAPKSRDSELAGALKSPAQVRGTEEPSFAPPVSRSRGRPKPSESAPPPRTSEVMAPPRNAPSLSTETKGWPAGGESNSTNSVQGGREPVPRVAATPVSGSLAAPSSEPSVPESGGPTRPVSQSPPWAEDKGRPPATTAGLATSDAQQRQSVAELLNSPSSHHGSPASSSSFSSSSALVTTTAATDTGAAASPAPRPTGSKADGTDPDQGGDPARNSRSMLIRRRRIKLLKRRHKNIVDPVLLADVEELVRRLAGLGMPRGAGRTASNSGEVRTPACFQTRKYGRKRKPPQEKVAKPDREAVDDVDKKKSSSHHTPVCPQEDENKEQCLPLKKRYHHISQSLAESISSLAKSASLPAKAGFCAMESTTACKSTAPRAEKVSDKVVNKAQELYSPGDTGKGPDRVNSVESHDHPSVICKALVKRQCVESSTKSVTSKVPCKLTLTKSEQASKKQSISRSRAQSGDGSHSRAGVHKAQTPDRPENQKQTAKHKASDLVDGGQKLNAKADEKGAVSANKRAVTAASESAPPASTRLAGTAGQAAEGSNAVSSTKKSDDVQTPGGDKTRAVSLPGPEDRRRRRRPTADAAPSGHPGRRRRWRRRPRSGSERPDSKTESTAECPPVPSPPPADVPTVSAPVPTPDTAPPSGIPASCPDTPAVSVTVEAVAARSDSVPAKVESDPPPVGDVCPAPCAEGPADTLAKSPQDTAALTVRRKRRKINRTGFPNKKKKVRLKSRPPTPGSTAAAPEPAVALPEAPQPDGEPTAVPPAASLAAADKDMLQSECLGPDTEPPSETTPAEPEHTAMGEQRARELRRPRRPAPARPRPTQLQQTPVVRLDKMSEPPVAPPRHEQPPSGAASDTGSEAAPPRSEPADTGRPAARPTSHRLATRKRSKATTSPAPNNKRARVDRTDLPFVEDDIYFESDPLISESGPSSEVPSGDELHRSAATTVKTRMAAPKWKKKKYITAGLFSDFYKVESESERPELNKSRLTYDPSEHEHGLLPPPCYEEKWLRHRPRDFTLPYDLWWLQANGQLPGRDAVASWNYKKLRTNYYFDVKPPPPREVEACSCRPPVDPQRPGCGDDCINRMMFVECSSSSCPCGDRCDNQRIQRHRWTPGLVKFMTGEKGWGIMTRRPIRAGTFILEYVGEIVSEKEFKRRMQTRYINDQHHYCLNLDRGMVIDGHRMGSIGRFVNHSCSPNCEMQKWEMNGLHRMALFSKEDIPGGTELTYDYNFALFNPAVGQKCHCGSEDCRGVIGGRSQRVGPPQTERGRGRGAGTTTSSTTTSTTGAAASTTAGATGPGDGGAAAPVPAGGAASAGAEPAGVARNERRPSVSSEQTSGETAAREPTALPVRPLSARDVRFIRLHRSFLVRNYEKMRRQREPPLETARPVSPPAGSQEETFRAHLRALDSSRSVRTRRLAAAEDDPQMVRTLKLAHILKEIHQAVVASTGEHPGPSPVEALTLPRRPRVAAARDSAEAPCSLLPEPLDIAEIERHIVTGQYKTADAFDHDFRRLFTAQLRAHGRCSPIGAAVLRLKHKYAELKTVMMSQIQEVLGVVPSSFRPPAKRRQDTGLDGEEDTIRCVCSLHREEGLMIQCERCLVWQHCDCVDADPDVEKYACELCEPRYLSPEVRLKPQPEDAEPGLTYYLSLMRDQLQVRQGDCVYIMQGDMVRAAQEAGQVPYKFVKRLVPDELLIFRVEKLWKDESGARFAFGYHYCRPQETYHEPTRKFFPKEVMRSPLYEVVPLELVVGICWVLDVNTYCKGRPVGASEHSVYVCEYRVDKTARLFAKLTKNRHPICTKAFAFDSFETRLKISRTFTPHAEEVAQKMKTEKVKAAKRDEVNAAAPKAAKPKVVKDSAKQAPPPVKVETPDEKRARQVRRLDGVLLRLLARLPGPPLDVSQMLGPGKRHRRRPATARV
ncbi:histone-lysine N-methyltransferase ash1-like [Amphibalanus amphitrite]|uniref:histone-lysine N-methyltransferase ash1-like n=1 Tax=Amphibalanus amphitrite TaxID=1232801 RepID=UPI001C8FB103|nr:histone-lysine N-methyltransferase ash1-like [Amphibalanus amphitrite]